MNILVIGADGQLGRSIRDASRTSENRFIFTDVTSGDDVIYLDASDPSGVKDLVAANGVDVIINCAGYTDVNKAETDEDVARKLNADLPAVLASAAKEAGAVLIHISTDYVFDGRSSVPYVETDTPAPLGAYAYLPGWRTTTTKRCNSTWKPTDTPPCRNCSPIWFGGT